MDECRSMLKKFVENRKLIECNESTDSDSNEEYDSDDWKSQEEGANDQDLNLNLTQQMKRA